MGGGDSHAKELRANKQRRRGQAERYHCSMYFIHVMLITERRDLLDYGRSYIVGDVTAGSRISEVHMTAVPGCKTATTFFLGHEGIPRTCLHVCNLMGTK